MATYCTRIFVKVDAKELMEKLCALNVTDLGKGFYKAEDIFDASSTESNFYDGESGINEGDLLELVERVVAVIKGHGTILADTYSYDYDPFPQVCYYNGGEITSKLLEIDGYEFGEMAEITNVSRWIQIVENADAYDDNWDENEDDEDSDSWDEPPMGMDEETLRDIMGIVPDENGFAMELGEDENEPTSLFNYFGKVRKVVVPDCVNELAAGCFAGNETIEEVILPESLIAMDMCCFVNCPNLRRVYVPASVESFGCDNSTFRGCPNLTICAPMGSAAETYAKKNNIPFVAE